MCKLHSCIKIGSTHVQIAETGSKLILYIVENVCMVACLQAIHAWNKEKMQLDKIVMFGTVNNFIFQG